MATKAAALQAWLEGFGLPVYRDSAVPGEAAMPYITYGLPTAAFGTQCNSEVNLWYRTSSEAAPNAKAEEVARALGLSGVLLPCDGGGMWVMQGEPFCNAMADEDNAVKRRIINLTIEYMTSY